MGKYALASLFLLLNLAANLLNSLAVPYCPPPKYPPKLPPKHPPHIKPPFHPRPPKSPPVVKPPHIPKPPKPPIVFPPPYVPKPPVVYQPPPVVPKPPPTETPCPPPPPHALPSPTPQGPQTCPIDTLKLGACVDVLGGLVHVGIGSSAKDTCCPVLQGLLDLDAAVCLCTTIKAKLLNLNIIIPIALELLVGCGKTPPPGFKCSA
ncbi:hypothetical protein CIPAW_03G108900 [Carya illinoinensis]|uniref:Bifunctional inhibitor/plant lipid transfer protein/seed storage helical domain-containing protein n=1 Tax=Carya illinoinensis TaxID=32201 RepID=A0A8T1R293_CARIL|nr:hypothetical protein CIPAW_03G108900 [Carya illinoinensis]